MRYKDLIPYLESISNEKFADFAKTLSNSDYLVFGVKNPVLREFIKEHKLDEELDIEEFELGKYLEVDFIYFGLGLSRLNDIDAQLKFIKKKIRYCKSWAITDTLNPYLKKISFDKYWDFFISLYQSKYTYERRIAYVLGLKFYQDKNILNILNYINKNEEYMVMMAEAWLLATIAIKYPDEIYRFLENLEDLPLKRKTISKISDSFRFNEETKNKFKSLRTSIK